MNKETTMSAAARIIAGRVYGPFREQGGTPGDRQSFRLDTAARAYVWNRRVRKLPAGRALELAAPYALRPYSERPPQWFGARGSVGAAFEAGGDSLRWFEGTADAGLRFIGWSDELPGGPEHSGWFMREDDWDSETLRGGVWQLPGRKGRARLVYGYAVFESGGRREMNPGSAAICVSDILETEGPEDSEYIRESDAARDAARYADRVAELQAEESRDYDAAWQKGREAAEHDAECVAARRELLRLLPELRPLRRSRVPMAPLGRATCEVLRARVDSLLETISASREARDKLWDDCGSYAAEAWRAGFCDNAEGGFRRAVALGYASRADWEGPPERNPCGPESVA